MTSFMCSINLYNLIDECSKLALAAGKVIREVHGARLVEGNGVLNGHLKEDGDPKSVATVADIRAQRVIVSGLQAKFPGVCIVGEEDDSEEFVCGSTHEPAEDDSLDSHPFIASRCLDLLASDPKAKFEYELDSIVVFIDPLDGTHEFVEGRVKHVQTLIGIAINGYPLAGVVGLPFWGQEESVGELGIDLVKEKSEGAVIAGCVGVGTFGFQKTAAVDGIRIACSESIKHPALAVIHKTLTATPINASPVVTPACGNKILSLVRGECDIAVFNLKTSLWDTCATQALLVSAGGQMSDLTGSLINHSHPSIARSGAVGNVYGVVATTARVSHSDVVKRIRCLPEVTSLFSGCGLKESNGGSALDVCRDTYGLPLTTLLLSDLVGATVVSYQCPEADAQRYLMSTAARLYLTYSGEENVSGKPVSIFYKRAVMRDLPHVAVKMRTAPSKVRRDVQSYLVEASFLASRACRVLGESPGLSVAKCMKAEIYPNASAVDSKFSLLLEDFSPKLGWRQFPMLDEEQLLVGIKALARFHAFFWNGGVHNDLLSREDVDEIRSSVWNVASHWAPSRQAPDMMEQIAQIWENRNYGDAEVGFGDGSEGHMRLGERLQKVAKSVARKCHFESTSSDASVNRSSVPSHPHFTVIHGDAKAGNLFFRKSGESGSLQVGLIDFQWCGLGLGATDLAYYIASSAMSSALDASGEKERSLLSAYHDVLINELKKLSPGSVKTILISIPSLDELIDQYESGLLDLCRIVFAYHWERIPASPIAFTLERQSMLAPCAYNKDTNVARWLVNRCDLLLKVRESNAMEPVRSDLIE